MRAATGVPRDPDLALTVSGSEALSFHAEMDERDLELKCRQFLGEYKKNAYKERFPWIDNLVAIKDGALCAALDEVLDDDLKNKVESLYLAPPGPIPWNESPEFTFRLKSREFAEETAPDLLIETYYRLLNGREDISLVRMKKSDRAVMTYGEAELTQRWPLYDCLVYETKYKNTHYFLSEGEWYSVNKNYRSRISDLIDNIPEVRIRLPNASEDQTEGEYNEDAAASSDSLVLMDRVLIQIEGRSSVELCDLLSNTRQLIHVKKRRGGSSSLSHLFAQGRISATLLLEDAQFRKDTRAKIKVVDEGFVQIVPENSIDPSLFEVVYAIISGVKEEQWQQQLPFFSRINLVEAYKALRRMQFKVGIQRIRRVT